MTGFGNSAAQALIKRKDIDLVAIFRGKRQDNPFPYYHCEHLYALALRKRISLYEGLRLKEANSLYIIRSLTPDLIVTSTFNQIISIEIIDIPKYGVVNVHPSLLPKYRGATPTVWALLNGEKETGVSIHFIENEKIDSGKIIQQSKIKINSDDTDGTLRFRLAELSKNTLSKAIDLILANDKSTFIPQDEEKASFFPKRTINDAEIDLKRPYIEIANRIRAMTPYPGARLNYNDKEYLVKSSILLNYSDGIGQGDKNCLDLDTRDGKVRFLIEGNIGE